jgi:hypothetical protein
MLRMMLGRRWRSIRSGRGGTKGGGRSNMVSDGVMEFGALVFGSVVQYIRYCLMSDEH